MGKPKREGAKHAQALSPRRLAGSTPNLHLSFTTAISRALSQICGHRRRRRWRRVQGRVSVAANVGVGGRHRSCTPLNRTRLSSHMRLYTSANATSLRLYPRISVTLTCLRDPLSSNFTIAGSKIEPCVLAAEGQPLCSSKG